MTDSHTRLLDMLAGWSNYIGSVGGASDEYVKSVADLYQQAGDTEEMTDLGVRNFLAHKVYPLLHADF